MAHLSTPSHTYKHTLQFKNEDFATAKFGLNNMKTKVQRYKKGVDFHLVTGQTPNQVFWEFERAGAAASINRVRTTDKLPWPRRAVTVSLQ